MNFSYEFLTYEFLNSSHEFLIRISHTISSISFSISFISFFVSETLFVVSTELPSSMIVNNEVRCTTCACCIVFDVSLKDKVSDGGLAFKKLSPLIYDSDLK